MLLPGYRQVISGPYNVHVHLHDTGKLSIREKLERSQNIPKHLAILFTGITCVPPAVANATITSSSPYYQNDSVTYSCNSGYKHTGGDLSRTCTAINTLSGTEPVCLSK